MRRGFSLICLRLLSGGESQSLQEGETKGEETPGGGRGGFGGRRRDGCSHGLLGLWHFKEEPLIFSAAHFRTGSWIWLRSGASDETETFRHGEECCCSRALASGARLSNTSDKIKSKQLSTRHAGKRLKEKCPWPEGPWQQAVRFSFYTWIFLLKSNYIFVLFRKSELAKTLV